jgi:triosephosphate isomerase
MSERIALIAGNWKMNLGPNESAALVMAIARGVSDIKGIEVLVAPPFTSLTAVKKALTGSRILLAGQNMHWETAGAFTGEISGQMLVEAGCSHVILGHSERRGLFKESNEMVALKVDAALRAGLTPIICIGETLEERDSGRTFEVVKEQLEGSLKSFIDKGEMPRSTILAYEPVWAIGTGRTATPDQAQEVHRFVREWIIKVFNKDTAEKVRILYGGSVKPDNTAGLMSRHDIDGALVGGASLNADSFLKIIKF